MTTIRKHARRGLWPTVLACAAACGCSSAALTGVPAHRMPSWLLAQPRANRQPINLIRLRQDPPAVYQLGPRDILGVYIAGVLPPEQQVAERVYVEQPPPIHFPEGDLPPALGYPIPVRDDGTVNLPLIPPIKVSGLTLTQAENEIRQRYFDAGITRPNEDRPGGGGGKDTTIVTLIRKRTYQVLVVREDQGTQTPNAQGLLVGPSKRGAAYAVDLKAYENDVMHALAETGGLPGLDAKNEVLILRGSFADAQSREGLIEEMVNCGPYNGSSDFVRRNPNVIRIPLRRDPGQPPIQLAEEDIILATGDIIFIETREREVFYTGGLLNGREIPLPRDYDLDVLAAMALAGGATQVGLGTGTLGRSSGGVSGGIVPPTLILVIRKLPDGGTIPIKISLNRALVDPSQRLLVQPGDYVMLQYTGLELAANVVLSTFTFNYFVNKIQ